MEPLERAVMAIKDCRAELRRKHNEELGADGFWADHTFQPTDEQIAHAVIEALREPDESAVRYAVGMTDFVLPPEIGRTMDDHVKEMRMAYMSIVDSIIGGKMAAPKKPNAEPAQS